MNRLQVESSVSRRLLLVFWIGLLWFAVPCQGQSGIRPPQESVSAVNSDRVEKAITFICQDRKLDPEASLPIDEMAVQPPFPLTASRVIAGRDRAQSMLPVAKRLLPFALNRVAARYGLEPLSSKWIVERIHSITAIRPDVAERDNASWYPSEPNAVVFGTVFLSALRSKEAILAVLAHEITHAIDGTDNALQPIFRRVNQDSSSVSLTAVEELVCELVAIEVVRDYVSQTSSNRSKSRRLARPLQKNCVSLDLSDAHHLSPRNTMRTLLRLDPTLKFSGAHNPKSKQTKHKPVRGKRHNRKRR
jgi:hypothetical protein